jgi:hypothetical protein
MENNMEEINLAQYLRILVKNKKIILSCFFIGIFLGLVGIFLVPVSDKYQAEALIKIGKINNLCTAISLLQNSERPANEIANEINYSFSKKYPSLNATVISGSMVRVTNSSADKEEAEGGISDVFSEISLRDDNFKSQVQTEIDQLKKNINSLRISGQQTSAMDLRLFDMQNELNAFAPYEIIIQPTIFSKGILNPAFFLVLGGFSGFLIGLAGVFGKEWWNKNKKIIF